MSMARALDMVMSWQAVGEWAASLYEAETNAGLERGEQGDVWGRVEATRALPPCRAPGKVSAMVDTMTQLLTLDARPLLADGPFAPLQN